MRKFLSAFAHKFLTSLFLVMYTFVPTLSVADVFASETLYNGSVSGWVGADGSGVVSGNTTGVYNTTISGIVNYFEPVQLIKFAGTISGDITGDITGGVNYNGFDTLSAQITGSGATGFVYLIGHFEGAMGEFVAEFITTDEEIDFSTTVNITGPSTVSVGETVQFTATTDGASQDVAWTVWANPADPNRGNATIDEKTGLLTGITMGPITVIASALDGSLVTKNHSVTVVDTTAPTVPVLLFPTDNQFINSQNLYIEWADSTDNVTTTENITYKYRLYTKDPNVFPGASFYEVTYTGTTRHPLAGYASGTGEHEYWYTVQAIDELDNESGFAPYRRFVVDNTAPTITWNNPNDSDLLSGDISLDVTCDGTPVDCDYINFWWWRDDQTVQDAINNKQYHYVHTNGTQFVWTLDSLNPEHWDGSIGQPLNGVYTLRAAGKDLAGNYHHEEITINIDNIEPSVPTNLRFETLEGDALSCSSYTDHYDIIARWDESSDETGIAYYEYRSFNPPDGWEWGTPKVETTYRRGAFTQGEGTYGFRVRAVDLAGNPSEWTATNFNTSCQITYDFTPPLVPTGIYFRDTVNGKDIQCGEYTSTTNLDVYWDAITEDPSFSHYEYSSFNAPNGSPGLVERIFDTNYFNSSFWTIPKEGVYGVQIRSVDEAGNKSGWYGGDVGIENSCQFIVDWTAPIIDIVPSRDPDIGPWYSTRPTYNNVYPTHTIDNDDPTATLEFKWNDGSWQPYAEPIEYEVDGIHTLYVRGTDPAGNVGLDELEVWLDFSNPEGTFLAIPNSNGFVRGTIELNFDNVYDPSGSEEISRIEIWSSGYKGSATKTGEGTYTFQFDTNILGDGDHSVTGSIFDKAGNRTRLSQRITVDNTSPTSTLSILADHHEWKGRTLENSWRDFQWFKNFVEVTIDIQGEQYDFVNYALVGLTDSCNTATYSIYTGNLADEVNLMGDGQHKLCYHAEDLAGNTEDMNYQILKRDASRGTATFTYVSGNEVGGIYFTQSPVEIRADLVDMESGIARTRLYVYDSDNVIQKSVRVDDVFGAGTTYSHTSIFEDLENGDYYVRVLGYDKAQNHTVSLTSRIYFTVDNTPPVLSQVDNFELIQGTDIEPVIVEITENVGLEKVCVNLPDYSREFCDDTISSDITEYDFMQFVFDELGITVVDTNVVPIGEYNIEYYVHDLAGNRSAIMSLVINIVKNQPTVQIERTGDLTVDILPGTPVTLSATVTGGTAPFTYQWGGDCTGIGETTEFTSTTAGDYTCTVLITDSYGNTSEDEINIVVSPAPTPTPTVSPDTGDVAGTQDQTTTTTTTQPLGTGGGYIYAQTTVDEETEEEIDDTEVEEETEEVQDDDTEVRGTEDENGEEEEEGRPWWIYPLIILPLLLLFIILWKKRKDEEVPQY